MSISSSSPLTSMMLFIGSVVVGLIFLVWSADKFVQGSASIAKSLGMSTLMIGLTIVALGTSAPEILVSSTAALSGSQGLAIGNAIGSNIANIGLVLGITALIAQLPVTPLLKRQEIPAMLIVTLVAGLLLMDQHLGLMDGIILVSGIFVLMALLYKKSKNSPSDNHIADEMDDIELLSLRQGIAWFCVALIILLISSKLLVWGATGIARTFGVSEVIIGLTIVAIGTSLPELAASVAGALKGHHDIAIGNVVGSNVLNLLAVLSLPGLLAPAAVDADVIYRDYPMMLGITLLMTLFATSRFLSSGKSVISKGEGSILLICYFAYLAFLAKATL